jgi:dolichol-phosphate mannosyltransferase
MTTIRRDRRHSLFRPAVDSPPFDDGPGIRAPGASLSIVIPSKDEAGNLPPLVEQVVRAFRPLLERPGVGHRLEAFEVIVVDDGSTDGTRAVLRRLVEAYPEVRPISLAANVGQSAATIAGFRVARGDWVGVLDADLQNPPEDLAKLWDFLPGFDAALGWRTAREDRWSRRVISRLANRVRNFVLGQSIKDTGCSVRIFPREVALRLPAFHGVHRFFGPLLLREGCRVVQVPVGHRPRTRGKSHYHFGNRSIRVVEDLLGVAWLLRRPVRYRVERTSEMPKQGAFSGDVAGREGAR